MGYQLTTQPPTAPCSAQRTFSGKKEICNSIEWLPILWTRPSAVGQSGLTGAELCLHAVTRVQLSNGNGYRSTYSHQSSVTFKTVKCYMVTNVRSSMQSRSTLYTGFRCDTESFSRLRCIYMNENSVCVHVETTGVH